MQPWLVSPHDLVTGADCDIRDQGDGVLRCVSPGGANTSAVQVAPSTRGDKLHVLEARGADGSRFPFETMGFVGLYDDHWTLPCSPQYLALSTPGCGDGLCVPPSADDFGFFADPSCTTRLLAHNPGMTPAVVARSADGYHAVGPAWKGPVFQGAPGSCELMQSPPDFDYFEVGPAVDSSEIAKIYFSYQGSGRLQIATLESDSIPLAVGKVGVPPEWVMFDASLQKTCRPVRTPNDGVRCFTGSLSNPETVFADPACTVPTVERLSEGHVAIVAKGGSTTGALPDVVTLGTADFAHPLDKVYSTDQGACAPTLSKQYFYALVVNDDWSPFAQLDERIGDQLVPP